MGRKVTADENEPEQSNFKIPSEGEKLMQVSDLWEDKNDSDIQVVKCEVVGGDEEGLSLLQRININDQLKSFYYTRLFLKAIGEPYKGSFEISPENWIGKQFYCTVKHSQANNKTYANINEYNFTKVIEQYKPPVNPGGVTDPKDIDIQWDKE